MFGQVGWGEILVLLVVGLFVFGPERLPKVARDAGRMLHQLRRMAQGVRDDLQAELGPEAADLDLRSLHPRTFVHKHLFGDDEDGPWARPADPLRPSPSFEKRPDRDEAPSPPVGVPSAVHAPPAPPAGWSLAPPYDDDAT